MWLRRALPVLLGILAGLSDLAVAPWLPAPWSAARVALPLVVLLALFSSPKRAFGSAITAGMLLDALLPTVGLVTVRLLVAAAAVLLASRIYLTNRTLIGSVVLGGVGLVADRLVWWVIITVRGFGSELFIPERLPPFIASGVWMTLCIAVAFVVFAAFTRRFLPPVSARR